jgi:CDP-4-dehydro-6-deoxyglucose reductase, E1
MKYYSQVGQDAFLHKKSAPNRCDEIFNNNRIPLIKSTFFNEQKTKNSLCNFIQNASILSMSKECSKFENRFAKKQGRLYSVFVSSGSCANLLLMQAMINTGKLKIGDKIFLSSLTWATNIMPIIQLGFKPVLLDIDLKNLNVSLPILKKAHKNNPDVKAFFITNALGFCSNLLEIKKFCRNEDIVLLEDNCESLGSEYQNEKLGNFGLASTFSFFVGHHLSTIEGGMICTNDKELYEHLKIARAHGWTRSNSNFYKNKMAARYDVNEFYDIYAFYELAYNFRPTEINGFLGNCQMKYWDNIVKKREENFKSFYKATLQNLDVIPLNLKGMTLISNFGFPLIFQNKEKYEYYKKRFIDANVEIRPIIGGNIANQPFYKKWVKEKTTSECKDTDVLHNRGFYFGNNPEMTRSEIKKIIRLLNNET